MWSLQAHGTMQYPLVTLCKAVSYVWYDNVNKSVERSQCLKVGVDIEWQTVPSVHVDMAHISYSLFSTLLSQIYTHISDQTQL